MASWEASLAALVAAAPVSGAAVVLRGAETPAYGAGELEGGGALPSATVGSLRRAFSDVAAAGGGEEEAGKVALGGMGPLVACGGEEFHAVRASFTGVYAVTRYRRRGLVCVRLPFGLLVAVCRRPHRLEALVPLVESQADLFRA